MRVVTIYSSLLKCLFLSAVMKTGTAARLSADHNIRRLYSQQRQQEEDVEVNFQKPPSPVYTEYVSVFRFASSRGHHQAHVARTAGN
jgi:hypothetical protein